MQREQAHHLIDVLFDLGRVWQRPRVPAGADRHFRAARREVWLGLRALADAALACPEPEAEPGQEPAPESGAGGGATSIPVEE